METSETQKRSEITPPSPTSNYAIPLAIVVAGLAIAAAIYFGNNKNIPTVGTANQVAQNISLDPVTPSDHILGNPDAKVIIVEYSDLECPFCKMFHPTMQKIMNEYNAGGQVAWVYRHLTVPQHPKAPKEAEASECVAKLGGNTKFWGFINKILEITPSNNGLDEALLPKIAVDMGIDKTAFEKCLANGDMKSIIDNEHEGAIRAGVNATPWSFVVADKKVVNTIAGSESYETVKGMIEKALR